MKDMIEGTFTVPDDYDTYDITIDALFTASSDPTTNLLINLLVTESTLENSK